MLLVNNGSFKSGSSWLGAIIRRLKRFHSPPDDYLDKHWENPHIPEARLASFLRTCDIGENDYYIKSHYAKPSSQSLLLGDPRVRVVLITRNLADVVVSAYFHFRRTAGTTDTFAEYFWTRGRLVANTVLRYDKLWAVSSPHVFRTTYAALQESPHEELRRLSAFILADADAAMIDAIIAETEFTAIEVTRCVRTCSLRQVRRLCGAHGRQDASRACPDRLPWWISAS